MFTQMFKNHMKGIKAMLHELSMLSFVGYVLRECSQLWVCIDVPDFMEFSYQGH